MRTWDRLSATFVRGLKAPGNYGDGGGLMLQATPTKTKGVVSKSWLFRFQIDKRKRWMGLGATSVVTLAEARAKANEGRKLLAAGIDPLSHRDAERMAARAAELHTQTFKQCLDGFLTSHGDKWRTKHLKQWQNSMATYAKPLFNINVADVDVGMVLKVVEPIWKTTPVTADRIRSRIGEVLGWAQTRSLRPPGPLPTAWRDYLSKTLPHPRTLRPVVNHPAMKYDEVPVLYRKLIASDAVPEKCLTLLLLTAVRSQEARGARWDEIENGVWTIPPIRMKRSREHRVPLSKEAMALIERLPRNGDYLFSINGSKPIVAMSLRKALLRNGGDGFTVHGFRSAFRDWGGERTHAPKELLEIALAHHQGDATERAYARSDLIEKRRKVMQQWATHLSAVPGREGAKVVTMVR